MLDHAIVSENNVHLSEEIPHEMMVQIGKVHQDLEELKDACQPLDNLAQNQEEKVRPTTCSMM